MTEFFEMFKIENIESSCKKEMGNMMIAVAEWIKSTTNKRVQLTLIVKFSRE